MANIAINAHKLKEAIKRCSYSSQELAKILGISPHDFYNSYKGSGIRYEKLSLIARKLGKPVEYFIEDDNYDNNSYKKANLNSKQYNSKPYNPKLYRKILDLIESSLKESDIPVTPDNIKNLHSKIYNIAVDKKDASDDFLEGVVKSTVEYYL
jgi:DNA-binding XRE family transcriptional regulator